MVSAWRSLSPTGRLSRALSATTAIDTLARAGARLRGHAVSERWRTYAEARLGTALADATYGPTPGDRSIARQLWIISKSCSSSSKH
jgi:hypothetical protein